MVDDAKKLLGKVKLYDAHIDRKLEELETLYAMATKITATLSAEPFGSSGNGDKVGNIGSRIADLQTEINQAIDNYVDLKRAIDKLISQIQNPEQVQVLSKRYLQNKTFETIANEINMSYRNVCYIHGRGLQAVAEIMEREKKNG